MINFFKNSKFWKFIGNWSASSADQSADEADWKLEFGNYDDGFTIAELAIVVAIIAALTGAVLIILNPVEYIGQGRDTKRIGDMDELNTAVGLYASVVRGSKGTANKVYISIPDSNVDCSGINGLPALNIGWSYSCVTEENYKETGGSGWLPVNLNALPGGSTVQPLPVDPENDAALGYYAYMVSASGYKLMAPISSAKFGSKAQTDGGVSSGWYEVGSDLSISAF
ncbi:MAG: prepilin-type N-terminal cleavage/methylation domain-containing protein [Candidatus Colwellbacteria bacterium]|nr:prepilin-type N-terminal cleavage/methylation domain-containing protein [Candidatus Colwellbacteria bacterium]